MATNNSIELRIDRNIFNDAFYPMLFDYSHRFEVYKGSAGSGKSHFISQKLIVKGLREKRRILCCRRFATTVRETIFQLFTEQLDFFGITDMCTINKTDRLITFPNGTQIIFFGLDDETKLLSLTNISDIWIEEVFEVPKDIVDQLNLRMRGSAPNQQIFMSFNPISATHWLYDFCEVHSPKSFYYHQSTYLDNKFLPEAYVDALEEMKVLNPRKAKIYCYGEWGTLDEDKVLPNSRVADFDIQELLKDDNLTVHWGVDLGFVDPSTISVSLWDKEKHKIYVIAEYYQRGATYQDVCQALIDMQVKHNIVYIDNADPRAVKYFKDYGVNAKGCKKGHDSVAQYISFLQDHEIICHKSCVNMAKELENFVYLRDKQTGELNPDKTDHAFSHLIDALKYSYSDVYRSNRLKTISKNMFGI